MPAALTVSFKGPHAHPASMPILEPRLDGTGAHLLFLIPLKNQLLKVSGLNRFI